MSFLLVVGQEQAIGKLQQALWSGRVPHGYIFHGPSGVGKELTARELAATLLCHKSRTVKHNGQEWLDSCGQCVSCRGIAADIHPDYHLVYRQQIRELEGESSDHKATELAIKVIRRKLNDPAQLTSAYGHGKVFVVREMNLANIEAQNALLKTLEEPPGGTVLIGLADRLEGLLPTILSRCQMVMFRPLPQEFILAKLREAGCNTQEAAFWARFGEGSLGQALWLAGRGWYGHKTALVERLAKLTSQDALDLAEMFIELAKDYSAQAVKDGLAFSATVGKGQMYSFLLAVVAGFYRDVMLCSGGSAESLWINGDQKDAVSRAGGTISLRDASRAVALASRGEYLLQKNVNANLVFEDLFGDLAELNCKAPVA